MMEEEGYDMAREAQRNSKSHLHLLTHKEEELIQHVHTARTH